MKRFAGFVLDKLPNDELTIEPIVFICTNEAFEMANPNFVPTPTDVSEPETGGGRGGEPEEEIEEELVEEEVIATF